MLKHIKSKNRIKDVILKINADEKGLMTGTVEFISGGIIVAESNVAVNIMSENFLFDVSLSIPQQYRSLTAGDSLRAGVNLLQVGPEEKVDVVVDYVIKDFFGNSYLEDSETFFVLGEKNFEK